ncbi:IS3 family transposase [Sphingobacterium pedocola]|uniref:Transposase n=1 Tax=Sphingobacterium pedocola TaxID=2082722 RepID=A0ABR9T310_9SPHI|nr:IS3 family transposase [Sphingobacterium pedocola]MBE8719733.1 transposase [Sphingobacterium pedocola]
MGIGNLCKLFGKSRHAYYDHIWRVRASNFEDDIILQEVLKIREYLPRVGVRKLHFMLSPILASHGIEVGRDYLFDLIGSHGLLVRTRRRTVKTTNSRHHLRKYPNIIKDLVISRPEQVWVSDITYIRLIDKWGYLSLVTDAYSRKIMGYCFREDMTTIGCVRALEMAVDNREWVDLPLIHHSDRGTQYCSTFYVEQLTRGKIAVSMTENGSPYENALAERVNGILKNEFEFYTKNLSFSDMCLHIDKSIDSYNNIRPHSSCDYLTPSEAHRQNATLRKRWKEYPKNYIVTEKELMELTNEEDLNSSSEIITFEEHAV